MTLLDRLALELKAAMIAKDAERLSTLRLLKSTVGYAQIERGTENLTDADVVVLIQIVLYLSIVFGLLLRYVKVCAEVELYLVVCLKKTLAS
jgi:hypothetical protein